MKNKILGIILILLFSFTSMRDDGSVNMYEPIIESSAV